MSSRTSTRTDGPLRNIHKAAKYPKLRSATHTATISLPAAIVLAGLGMAPVAKYARHSPYFTTGRGTDADALTLPMDRTAV